MKSNLSNNIKGFAYDFYFISMHAVAREGFDKPCIYCHLDTEELSEIRFEPNDSSKCNSRDPYYLFLNIIITNCNFN